MYKKGKNIESCCVGFRNMNFLHMTEVKTKISAQQFYTACLEGKLSIRDFEVDKKGKVQQKLAVLPYLSDLLYNKCMIGDFTNSGIMIKANYFVGNTKAVLSVGFRLGRMADISVTLYNEDVKKLSHPTCKVIAIYSKMFDEGNFSECTYMAKDVNEKLFPESIMSKTKKA